MQLLINSLILLRSAPTSQPALRVHPPSHHISQEKRENKRAPFHLVPTLEHGSLSESLLLLLPEELVAGAGAGQEQPESLQGGSRRSSGWALGVSSRSFPLPGSFTLRSGAGTKLRNSSTCPTLSQSEKSSTGACTLCASRKSRTAVAILRPPTLRGAPPVWGALGGLRSEPTPNSAGKSFFWGVLFSAPGSPGEAAADEDPPQRVLLAPHRHGWAHLQIPEGIQAGSALWSLPGHVAKIGALGGGKTGENGLKKMQLSALKGCTPKSSVLERPTLKMKEAKGFIPDFEEIHPGF